MPSLSDILNAKIGSGGKSKAYVANALGVGEKTIENYMRGIRNPKPDALVKLSQVLKFDLSQLSEQTVRTTATETPQNGHQNSPGEDNEIEKLIHEIQYRIKPKPSIEEIGKKIKVGRSYLTDLKNGSKPHSPTVYKKLKNNYKDILNDMTTSTKLPAFEMTQPKEVIIDKHITAINKQADTLNSQQETIKKLVDMLATKAK